MKLKVRCYDIEAEKPIVVMNEADAKYLGVFATGRIKIQYKGKKVTGIVDTTESLLNPGEIGVFQDIIEALNLKGDEIVSVKATLRPKSVDFIKKKVDGLTLEPKEIHTIIQDIVHNNLSSIELTAFVTSGYIHGYNIDEIVALTQAMVETGQQIDFGDDIVDKHCIGGVAGNRTTMLIVPMIAASGATIPKTSSRAITSPSGTADTMEVLSQVEFSISELQEIVHKTHGCIVWGGSVNLAPADDKIIRVEYPLSLDAEGHVLSSVMAKKVSVGSDYVLIDIPVGKGSKVPDLERASVLKHNFLETGMKLGISTSCLITDGTSPIGNGIGPALEARDVLLALDNKGPRDLIEKSIYLTGSLLELSKKVSTGRGRRAAKKILESGKAKKKMMEIIEAQGGNPKIKPEDIEISSNKYTVSSPSDGEVKFIDNSLISQVARTAGAPKNKTSGVYLHVKAGELVKKDQPLFTIYSAKNRKLKEAIKTAQELKPIIVA